jgi:hypothetical protein
MPVYSAVGGVNTNILPDSSALYKSRSPFSMRCRIVR